MDLDQALSFGPVRVLVFRTLSANELSCLACASRACRAATRAEGLVPRVVPFPKDAFLAILPVRLRSTLVDRSTSLPTQKEWWCFDPVANVVAVRSEERVDVWHADGRRVTIDLPPDINQGMHWLALHGRSRWLCVVHIDGIVATAFSTNTGLAVPFAAALFGADEPAELLRVNADVVFARFTAPPSAENARMSGFYDADGGLILPAHPNPWSLITLHRALALTRDGRSALSIVRSGDEYNVQLFGRAAVASGVHQVKWPAGDDWLPFDLSVSTNADKVSAQAQVLMLPSTFAEHKSMVVGRWNIGRTTDVKNFNLASRAYVLQKKFHHLQVQDDLITHVAPNGCDLQVLRGHDLAKFITFTMHGYVEMRPNLLQQVVVAADPVRRTFTVLPLSAYVGLRT